MLLLIKLTDDQVSSMWDAISFGLKSTSNLAPTFMQTYLNTTLLSIYQGKTQVWAMVEREEDKNKIYGFAVSCIKQDAVRDLTYLFIESLYLYLPGTIEQYKFWFSKLIDFAKELKCSEVKATTTNDRVIELMSMVGMEDEKLVHYSLTL